MRAEPRTALLSLILIAAEPAAAQTTEVNTNGLRYQEWSWKYSQRAYPLGYIPSQAKEKALTQIRQAKRAFPRAQGAGAANQRWINIGPAPISAGQTAPPRPVSGRITCLAVDPNNVSHWLAGAAQGGVWETTDAGATWVPRTDDQPSLAMGAVAFAPSNPAIILAGTGEPNSSDSYPGAGLLKSSDGGNTWTVLGAQWFAKTSFSAIRVNPANANYMVVATAPDRSVQLSETGPPPPPIPTNGVYLSTDGGANWTRTLTGPVVALEVSSGNFANQYAAIADGNGGAEGALYRSQDSGASWTKLTGPWAGKPALRVVLSISGANPNTLYACFANTSDKLLGLWRTDNAWDATPAWTKLPDPVSDARKELGQLDYGFALSVDPANRDIVYFAEIAVWKYDGKVWTTLGGHYNDQTQGIKMHPDQHALVWTGNRLLVANDGGVWSTTDGGATFLSHNTTLATIQFYHGSLNSLNPNVALGGEQDNGSSMWLGTNGWKMVGPGDGSFNAISAQNPNNNWLISVHNLTILRLTGAGQYESQLSSQQSDALFIAPFAMCPANENIVIAGASRLWRSKNVFSSDSPDWAANSPQVTVQSRPVPISAVAFAPSDNTGNTYAFGTMRGHVLVTSQGGSQGTDWSNWFEPDAMIPNRYVSGLAFDPTDPNVLYATVSGFDEGTPNQPGHLFRTRNALSDSAAWDNISPPVNLPNNCLAIDPKKPNSIYVGTDLGVWRTLDGGATWAHMGPESGMPNVAVFDLQIHPQTGRVFAFTHGRSAFILDPAEVSIVPSITSFGPTNGPPGTEVTIRGTKFEGVTAVQFNGMTATAFTVNSGTNLTTTVPAGATTGPIAVTTPGGTTTSTNNFVVSAGPSIADFSPKSGNTGTAVTITGQNFGGASAVRFGGVSASAFSVASPTQISATVPAGAATGRITVTTPAGTATGSDVFTITTAPVISGFSPSSGGVGSAVIITGANLAAVTSVSFNGIAAGFVVNGANQITATVPAGSTSGPLQVVSSLGTTTSGAAFTVVPAPVISGLSPASGAAGTKVTITGNNFTGATGVRFNGVNAATFSVDSASQLTATAPFGFTTGSIDVETPGGKAVSPSPFTLLSPPVNDNFVNALSITNNSGRVSGNNVAATKEPGEPDHAGNGGGKSIWYRWTAPANGIWTFDTQGSSFDTLLGVYTGSTVAALTEVGSNDNSPGNTWSSVTFYANSGTTYWLAIDGHKDEEAELQSANFADAGSTTLNWKPAPALPPAISDFAPGSGAVGASVVIIGTNFLGATSVTFGGLTASFQVNSASRITAVVPAGAVTGFIGVSTAGGTATSVGMFTVTVPPSNDNFVDAQTLNGPSGSALASNIGATSETGEPNHAGIAGGKSVWFVWTAPADGTWSFDTRGSSIDTLLALYTGTGVSSLEAVAANDNEGSLLTSALTFNAKTGTTYHLAVDGNSGAEGALALHWTSVNTAPTITSFTPAIGGPGARVTISGSNLASAIAVGFNGINTADFTVDSSSQITATVPLGASTGPLTVTTPGGATQGSQPFTVGSILVPNDNFSSRIALSGNTNCVLGSNLNCTKEPNEPYHAGDAGGRSVWWSWTAPRTGSYEITTAGSDFDTVLGVYVGNTLSSLSGVNANDDSPNVSPQSAVFISANAGTTYQIAVDGYGGASGRILLSIFPVTPPQMVYATGFESFEGYSFFFPLAGQNGWTSSGVGENGIVYDYFGDFGQQAYIGNSSMSPGDTLYVWQPLNFTPDTTTRPVVTFVTYLEIVDSSNGHYDDFDWDVYNKDGKRLFLLNFDNSDLHIYYRLNDTNRYYNTGFTFDNGRIYYLEVTMDFGRNRWSASLDGTTVVSEQKLSAAAATSLNLGDIDARWVQRGNAYGDNAMVFDYYWVWSDVSPVPRLVTPPQSKSVALGSNVVFFASADSTIPVSYQWLFNGAPISGATNQLLDLGNVNLGAAGTYQVVVSNVAGQVSSPAALLTISPLPNLAPYQPAGWSDRIVVTTTAGSTTDTAVLHDADDLYLDWAVWNSATNSDVRERFFTGLYLDNVLVNTWDTAGLTAGALARVTGYKLGKLSVGRHTVTVRTDLTSVVKEQDKNDNTYSRSFSVASSTVAAPVIRAPAVVQGNSFSFTIGGVPGQQYNVLTSTDLTVWVTNSIVTITSGDGNYLFSAPVDPTEKTRFFRLQLASP